jgi:hypothetical protein
MKRLRKVADCALWRSPSSSLGAVTPSRPWQAFWLDLAGVTTCGLEDFDNAGSASAARAIRVNQEPKKEA